MERWLGRVAIVSGASSGIGAALVRRLTEEGMKVAGCDRNPEGIENLAKQLQEDGGRVIAVKCDISQDDEVVSLVDRIRKEFGGIDVCVNNAGVFRPGTFLEGQTEVWKNMADVNIVGTSIMTREVIKDMRARGVDDGHIVFINSLAGHGVSGSWPLMNFYCVTKHAIKAMTECVRHELAQLDSNIRVSQVSPGVVKTNIYKQFSPGATDQQVKEYYDKLPNMSAKEVVNAVIYQLAAPANVQVKDILVGPIKVVPQSAVLQ